MPRKAMRGGQSLKQLGQQQWHPHSTIDHKTNCTSRKGGRTAQGA